MLVNIVYFLDSLDIYLEELKRALKPAKVVIVGKKIGLAQGFDPKISENTDLQKRMPSLEKRFAFPSIYDHLGDIGSLYHDNKLTKK